MTTFIIGDVHGCLEQLDQLLAIIDKEDPNAQLLFTGDIINRGPDSIGVLRRIMAMGDRAQTVLGNHDLHLLGIAAGIRKMKTGDTVKPIFDAPDSAELLDWFRTRPLAYPVGENGILVHAGLLPQWTRKKALKLANELETVLRSKHWQALMAEMYGNKPDQWDDDLEGMDRLRCIINSFTRLRFCTPKGKMEFDAKLGPETAPEGYMPWFRVPKRKSSDALVIWGHWSTLGLVNEPNLLAVDTGCLWGGALTAVRLEDRAVFQVKSSGYRVPGV